MKNDGFLAEVELLLNDALGGVRGTRALLEICQRHAGGQVYIPSKTALYLQRRNEEIRARFRGDNYFELERIYGLKRSQIRSILNHGG